MDDLKRPQMFEFMGKLAVGRSFLPYPEIETKTTVALFVAYAEGASMYRQPNLIQAIHPSDLVFVPAAVPMMPAPEFTPRPDPTDYMVLREQWHARFANRRQIQVEEMGISREFFLDVVYLEVRGELPANSRLRRPELSHVVTNGLGDTAKQIIKLAKKSFGESALERIVDFVMSRYWANIPSLKIFGLLVSHLAEQASAAEAYQQPSEKKVRQVRGDLNDAKRISVLLGATTDLIVDAKFSELLRKPDLKRYTNDCRIWTERNIDELIRFAKLEVASVEYQTLNLWHQRLPAREVFEECYQMEKNIMDWNSKFYLGDFC
ncbi:MAG: hypothetical protein WCK51_02210 [Armatimonadota bacterium]